MSARPEPGGLEWVHTFDSLDPIPRITLGSRPAQPLSVGVFRVFALDVALGCPSLVERVTAVERVEGSRP